MLAVMLGMSSLAALVSTHLQGASHKEYQSLDSMEQGRAGGGAWPELWAMATYTAGAPKQRGFFGKLLHAVLAIVAFPFKAVWFLFSWILRLTWTLIEKTALAIWTLLRKTVQAIISLAKWLLLLPYRLLILLLKITKEVIFLPKTVVTLLAGTGSMLAWLGVCILVWKYLITGTLLF